MHTTASSHYYRTWITPYGILCLTLLVPGAIYFIARTVIIPLDFTAGTLWEAVGTVGVVVFMCLKSFRQSLMVTDDQLMVAFGVNPLEIRKEIPLNELVELEVAALPSAMRMGWGKIDWKSFQDEHTIYTGLGKKGIRMKTANRKRLFVGTKEPEELIAAIRRVRAELGNPLPDAPVLDASAADVPS